MLRGENQNQRQHAFGKPVSFHHYHSSVNPAVRAAALIVEYSREDDCGRQLVNWLLPLRQMMSIYARLWLDHHISAFYLKFNFLRPASRAFTRIHIW